MRVEPLSYSQDNGEIVIDIGTIAEPMTVTVVVNKNNIMALLQTVMTALRFGNYDADTLNAAAMVCKANLGARLR